MPVILKVWSSNPFNNGGCDFAIVELTQELANVALRRITMLCDQKSLDSCLYETYYWGSEAEYFNAWPDQGGTSEDTNTACMNLRSASKSFRLTGGRWFLRRKNSSSWRSKSRSSNADK